MGYYLFETAIYRNQITSKNNQIVLPQKPSNFPTSESFSKTLSTVITENIIQRY